MATGDGRSLANPPSRTLDRAAAPAEPSGGSAIRAPRRSARVRAAIGGVLLLGLLGLATAVVGALVTPGGTTTTVAERPAPEGSDPGSSGSGPGELPAGSGAEGAAGTEGAAVIVHVLGAVRAPGIVEVRAGDRVVDAIAAAGGTTEDADLDGVNLARVVADGEQLRVPRAGEVVAPAPQGGGAAGGGAPAGASTGLVNVNTADAAALEALPGVGPALAARIIAWRDENGPFRAVDELLAVSGIGERTLEGFRDQVAL